MVVPSPPLLEARQVGRQDPRTGTWLLRDASLTLAAGDRLALTGRSGAGKTLLLRSLALLDHLSAGEVRWRGAPVLRDEIPGFRAQVVYLHQRPALFDGTVEQNLRLPLTLAVHNGKTFDRDRAVAWLARFGRDASFLTKSARELSGGEAQITALVRALGVAPTVLLLDEPVAALDAAAAAALADVVADWLYEAPATRACIWIGHDRAYVAQVTTRRLEVEGGRTKTPP